MYILYSIVQMQLSAFTPLPPYQAPAEPVPEHVRTAPLLVPVPAAVGLLVPAAAAATMQRGTVVSAPLPCLPVGGVYAVHLWGTQSWPHLLKYLCMVEFQG